MRALTTMLVGIAFGAGGVLAAQALLDGEPTPSLYTNGNGGDALRHPARHVAAAVQYRGTVIGDRRLATGDLVAMRIDGTVVAAHVYDSAWAPAYRGQPLEIQGRIRGTLGDPIDAPGIPVTAPLRRGMTLIDVSAATGPHARFLALRHARATSSTRRRSSGRRSGG